MARDILPPAEPLEGPRKRILTAKARQAAESQAPPPKRPRTTNLERHAKALGISQAKNPIPNRKKSVEVEEVSDNDNMYRSTPPRSPNGIIEGPDDELDPVLDVITVASTSDDEEPEKPAESAEAELSKFKVSI